MKNLNGFQKGELVLIASKMLVGKSRIIDPYQTIANLSGFTREQVKSVIPFANDVDCLQSKLNISKDLAVNFQKEVWLVMDASSPFDWEK